MYALYLVDEVVDLFEPQIPWVHCFVLPEPCTVRSERDPFSCANSPVTTLFKAVDWSRAVNVVIGDLFIEVGQGPGITTLFTSTPGKILPRVQSDANIADILGLRKS